MRRGVGLVVGAALAAACAACADPEPPPPPLPDAGPVTGDFAARCAGPGVVRCFAFDAPTEIADRVLLAEDNLVHASIDPDVARTGAGSLRFDVPSESGPNAAGAVWQHVAEDLSVQFGETDEVYIQWRQRFAPEMLRAFAVTTGAQGWHQLALGEGDRPGGFPTLSCTELEVVVEQEPAGNRPRAHHGCPVSRALPAAAIDYRAGEWMTFQLGVSIGTWNTPSSRVRLWAAADGATQALVLDAADFTLDHDVANGTDPNGRYGKLWLEPFIADKDPAEVHAPASTWYDDLIVARAWIGDPVP